MKKICLFFLVLILIPTFVNAKDLVLSELNILNGEISPKFEPLNNSYTIILDKDVYNVEFDYKKDDDIEIEIVNNFDLENNSSVEIVLRYEKNVVKYHFQILKEVEENINLTFLETNDIVENNFMFEYKNYIIPSTCIILIVMVNRILFHKKKQSRKKH